MANITIRNLDDDVKARLRVRAAEHSRSMEEEVRIILREAVSDAKSGPQDLAAFTRACFAPLGGVELEIPLRTWASLLSPSTSSGQALSKDAAGGQHTF